MAFKIRKIKTFPVSFNKNDEILADGESLHEIPLRLEDIGFSDAKTKIFEGTMVYYKGKTNAVYVEYYRNPNK